MSEFLRSAAMRPAASPAAQTRELSLKAPAKRTDPRKTALGLVCTRSFPAVVNIADMMLKSSGVTLAGYEKTGDGYCTAVVRGNYADVKIAVQTGIDIAKQFEQYVSSMMLPRPLPNLDTVLPITEDFAEYVERAGEFEATGAIGLIETTGFPAMVGASDAAMKCANVELITYETTGAGLCTAVIQGPIADVTMAVEAAMAEAERIGDLHAVAVIPRPLDDLMKVMPKPQHWVESADEPQPLELPDPDTVEEQAEEKELQPLALPELERVPVEIPTARAPVAEPLEIAREPELRELQREELRSPRQEQQSRPYLSEEEQREIQRQRIRQPEVRQREIRQREEQQLENLSGERLKELEPGRRELRSPTHSNYSIAEDEVLQEAEQSKSEYQTKAKRRSEVQPSTSSENQTDEVPETSIRELPPSNQDFPLLKPAQTERVDENF